MHLHWPWLGKKTPQFSREWVLVASLRNWNSWDARGAECGVYISSHPQFSSAAESVIPDTVYGLMSEGLRHTGGSETSRGINQEIPKPVVSRRISANHIICCLLAPQLSSRAWTCDNCDILPCMCPDHWSLSSDVTGHCPGSEPDLDPEPRSADSGQAAFFSRCTMELQADTTHMCPQRHIFLWLQKSGK